MVWRGWRWAGLKTRNCQSSQPGAKFCFSCYFVTFKNKNFFRMNKAKVSVVFGQKGHKLFWAKHLFGASSSSSSSYYSLLSFLKFLCQVKSGEGEQTLRWQKWGSKRRKNNIVPDQATSFSARAAAKSWRRRCSQPPPINISAPPRLSASPHRTLVHSHARLHLQ